MGFHPQEIETAIRNDLSVIFLVLCDRQWGMVKFGQGMALDPTRMTEQKSLPEDRTINTDFEEIRFDLLAQSMGRTASASPGRAICGPRSSAVSRAAAVR